MLSRLFGRFMEKSASIKVLVVCMENICRSPMAEGALKQALAQHGLSNDVKVESAGTHVSQPGSRPDIRAIREAQARGIDITKTRARRIKQQDFYEYDYIFAVDRNSLRELEAIRSSLGKSTVHLYMAYSSDKKDVDIADPYYGNEAGFKNIMDFMELGAGGIALHISGCISQ